MYQLAAGARIDKALSEPHQQSHAKCKETLGAHYWCHARSLQQYCLRLILPRVRSDLSDHGVLRIRVLTLEHRPQQPGQLQSSRLEDLRSVCNAWFGLLRLKSFKTEIPDSRFQIPDSQSRFWFQASNPLDARFFDSRSEIWNLES